MIHNWGGESCRAMLPLVVRAASQERRLEWTGSDKRRSALTLQPRGEEGTCKNVPCVKARPFGSPSRCSALGLPVRMTSQKDHQKSKRKGLKGPGPARSPPANPFPGSSKRNGQPAPRKVKLVSSLCRTDPTGCPCSHRWARRGGSSLCLVIVRPVLLLNKRVTRPPGPPRPPRCAEAGCRGEFPRISERRWRPGGTCSSSRCLLYAITPPPAV